jgi:hypothetical protein
LEQELYAELSLSLELRREDYLAFSQLLGFEWLLADCQLFREELLLKQSLSLGKETVKRIWMWLWICSSLE